MLRRTIARSDRGVACAARYSPAALERELTAVFEAVGWSLAVTATADGPRLAATDPRGRRREATVIYPETPLGTVSVRGLLEDDEFLPELPAAEPATVRIEYPDECAPVDGPETAAAAEADGFEWVDAGDLERTRLSGE